MNLAFFRELVIDDVGLNITYNYRNVLCGVPVKGCCNIKSINYDKFKIQTICKRN